MVRGAINGHNFAAVLEPDGWGSHWFSPDNALRQSADIKLGDTVHLTIEATKDWIEPDVPSDIAGAITAHPTANETWQKVTPMARWEWIRWVRATNKQETRARRIKVACSKLESGMRRPCCFNASACTVPEVSKNGALLVPTQVAA